MGPGRWLLHRLQELGNNQARAAFLISAGLRIRTTADPWRRSADYIRPLLYTLNHIWEKFGAQPIYASMLLD